MPKDHSRDAASLPSPLVPPLGDNATLVAMLADLLDRPAAWVRQHLHEEELCMGKHHREEFAQFGAPPHVWSDRLAEYYEQSRTGRLSLVTWNRRPEKLQIRHWIGQYLARFQRPFNVLVVGDGAGFDSLYLHLCGHAVTYFELSRWAKACARQVFAHSQADIQMITRLSEVPTASYDAVVCLDVLEHVTDPPALVADMARYLRADGLLIVHAPFFFVSPMCPTHLSSNRRYSGSLRLFQEQHFRLAHGRFFWDPLVLVRGDVPGATRASMGHRMLLRVSGTLLATARLWNLPHNWMAHRALCSSDARWLDGLDALECDS